MFFMLRIGRYAARSGGRGPAQPKKQAGPGGQAFGGLAVLALVIWAASRCTWFACGLIAFVLVMTVVIMANWHKTAPAPRRPDLDELMKDYGKEGK